MQNTSNNSFPSNEKTRIEIFETETSVIILRSPSDIANRLTRQLEEQEKRKRYKRYAKHIKPDNLNFPHPQIELF